MQNQSNIHGNHNIILQGVSNSTITLSVDGELKEIRNDIAALLTFLQQQQQETIQLGEKIYNIKEIGQATFQTIIQQAPFLPSKELTLPPFYPEVFIGREDDLKAIYHQLFNENNLLLLVNGEGGIGKTTLALRYYFEYKNHYQHLAWVFAEQSLLDALLTLSLPLGVDFPQAMPNTERLTLLLRKMANLQRPCLLIIDNANLLEDLERYYPQLSTCRNFHLLLTTRITQFEAAKTYAIQPLAPEKAIALFQQYYKTEETELLLQILTAVGYNTLVIELLAKNLKNFNQLKNRYSLSDLLQDLQQKGLLALQSKAVNTLYHSEGALRTEKPAAIIAAMYDLNELSEAERQLMSIFAVLPAENIPFETLETLLPNTEHLDDTLLALAQKGWLDYNEPNAAFKCSPVIQEISRHKNQEHLLEHCETLMYNLNEKLDYQPGVGHFVNTTYEEAALYARYGESIVNSVEQINRSLYVLCERIGNFYNTVGNLENAFRFFEYSRNYRQILCEAYPEDENYKNDLAISYEKLGETHSALGNLEPALRFFEEEQKLKEELFKDFPDNVRLKNGLAISYLKLGETHSALGNLEQALRFFEERNRLGKELYEAFPNNVGFKNGLAVSYEKLGDTHSALGNLEQALRFFEERNRLGKELYEAFPNNVGFKNGLAISYEKLGATHSALGNLEQALRFFEDETQLFEELYAAFPNNVGFKNGLALSYQWLGWHYEDKLNDKAKALPYYQSSKELLAQLVNSFPAYVQFKKNLDWVEAALGRV